MTWVPLGANSEEFNTSHEGIPPWLETPLATWILRQIATSDPYGDIRVNAEVLQNFDIKTRNSNPISGRIYGENVVGYIQSLDPRETLKFVDFLLSEMSAGYQSEAQRLADILENGGSVWTVGERSGVRGLERRVIKPVQEMADLLISHDDAAAKYLMIAWNNCYGLNPNPDVSFTNSIKAVEAKLSHRIRPNDATATLGKILGDLRKSEKWRLSLEPSNKLSEEDDLLYQMARALWKGQKDRHGSAVVQTQTQQEAEVAITLACSIIQLFNIEHDENYH